MAVRFMMLLGLRFQNHHSKGQPPHLVTIDTPALLHLVISCLVPGFGGSDLM